jgi:hypothetical protein
VQALLCQGKPIRKIPLHFNEDHGPSQAKISPPDSSPDLTGFAQNELIKIDHSDYFLAMSK